MIEDKRQALDDLLMGWRNYVFDGLTKRYDAYPAEYVTFLDHLYCENTKALIAGIDPADFLREHLLPLFGVEPAPRVMYGWTEQDVLGHWDDLRSWGEVANEEMPVEDAVKLLEEALAKDATYTSGDESLDAAIQKYATEKGLVVDHDR